MTPPTDTAPPVHRFAGYVFSAAVVATLVSAMVVFPQLSPAKGKAYPDIVALEFAGWNAPYGEPDNTGNRAVSADSALGIVTRWRADVRLGAARADVGFDFFFILCYTVVFFYGVRLAATAFPGGARFGCWLARGQVVAGLCDCLENVFLLWMLAHGAEDDAIIANGQWMTAFVYAKFALLLAGASYMVVAACEPLRRRVERL